MIDLYSKRKYFFALSILLVLAGLIGLAVNGVQLDIQFQGGTVMQVEMPNDDYDAGAVESAIRGLLNKNVTAQKLQTFNASNTDSKINLLMLKVSKEDTLTGEQLTSVLDLLKKDFGVKADAQLQIQNVEPFMGAEMLQKGVLAIILSSVITIIYVWWRFSIMTGSLSAALFANLALLHDAFVMFAVYTIFKLPLNESFVAAVLTILGYSINDTIVIYDRIRENTRLLKKMPIAQLVNTSVMQTMARSINTTVTVIICVLTVLIFAIVNNIQSIKEFTMPLMVGLLSGTYSTIFIASPLYATWQERKTKKKVALKASKA